MKRWIVTLIAATAFTGCAAQAAEAPRPVYSIRTEPGARGHTLTTVTFLVTARTDERYLCVVTEDTAGVYGGTDVAIAQSCDFSVAR